MSNTNESDVKKFFSTPINNKSALRCYGDVDNADYSGFETNFSKYLDEKAIYEMIKVNSEITNFFQKFKISIKINMDILNDLIKNHLPHTRNVALGIAKYLPEELQKDVNHKALAEATGLHDLAKVIMPEDIINKKGALNPQELEIMEKHAILSYEMLKTTDLDNETLHLIKNHHHNPLKTNGQNKYLLSDINLQILSLADIYSALREKRSYKDEMSKEQSLKIIKKEVDNGKFHPIVYKALVEYVK